MWVLAWARTTNHTRTRWQREPFPNWQAITPQLQFKTHCVPSKRWSSCSSFMANWICRYCWWHTARLRPQVSFQWPGDLPFHQSHRHQRNHHHSQSLQATHPWAPSFPSGVLSYSERVFFACLGTQCFGRIIIGGFGNALCHGSVVVFDPRHVDCSHKTKTRKTGRTRAW